MATVFGSDAQVLSTWPAGIRYNPNEDKYTFSVANNWKISPQDHLHVVDIDGPLGLGPYELTLQLPILNQLPFSSRMYFFYVSNSQDLDLLTFIPTPLSGDTVNGSPFFHSFTMSGNTKLLIALAVNGNYIIHEFGYTPPVPIPPTPYSTPLVCHRAVLPTPSGAITYTKGTFPSPADAWPASGFTSFYWTSDAWNPVPDPLIYNTGMDGYITYAKPVPGQTLPGFVVQKTGLYRVTYEISHLTFQTGIVNIQGNTAMGACVINVTAAGAYVDHFFFATNMAQGVLNTQAILTGNGSKIMHLVAGTSVCGGVNIPSTWTGSPTNVSAPSDYSSYIFELIRDDSAPAPLMALRSLDSAASSSSSSVVVESPMHSQLPSSKVVQLQKQNIADKASAASSLASKQARQLQNSALNLASDIPPSTPSFTLADIEKIVGQALAKQSLDFSASAVSNAPAPKRKRVSIGGSSSSSSSLEDPSKSRKLTVTEEKEEEIL